jgi:hypothetical protein
VRAETKKLLYLCAKPAKQDLPRASPKGTRPPSRSAYRSSSLRSTTLTYIATRSWKDKLNNAVLYNGLAKTEVISNNLNPNFKKFSACLSKPSFLKSPEIHVRVYDEDAGSTCLAWAGINTDDCLGELKYPISVGVLAATVKGTLSGKGGDSTSTIKFDFSKTNFDLRKDVSKREKHNARIVTKVRRSVKRPM